MQNWKNPEDANVNAPPENILLDFFILVAGVLGIILVAYVSLGFITEQIVNNLSLKQEQKLGELISIRFRETKKATELAPIQKVVDRLASHIDKNPYKFQVDILCTPEVNAFAVPGGSIVVTQGLLKKIKSENELATVLGHEIGHFIHRDHLRGLGRGVVFLFLTSILTSGATDSVNWIQTASSWISFRFNREQETQADEYAVRLVVKEYGHAGGTVNFFKILQEEHADPVLSSWFSTHPNSADRITHIEDVINQNHWKVEKLKPLEMGTQSFCL